MRCAGSMEMRSLFADPRAHPLGKHRQVPFQDLEGRDPSPRQTSFLPVGWVRFRACEWLSPPAQGRQHRAPPVLLPGRPRLAAQTRLLRPLLEATVPGGDCPTSRGCRWADGQMGSREAGEHPTPPPQGSEGAGTPRPGAESAPAQLLCVALGRAPRPEGAPVPHLAKELTTEQATPGPGSPSRPFCPRPTPTCSPQQQCLRGLPALMGTLSQVLVQGIWNLAGAGGVGATSASGLAVSAPHELCPVPSALRGSATHPPSPPPWGHSGSAGGPASSG